MTFYVNDDNEKDRVRVRLRDDEDGDVTVTLNSVPHLFFSEDGDLVLCNVAEGDRVSGVLYEKNHIKLFNEEN